MVVSWTEGGENGRFSLVFKTMEPSAAVRARAEHLFAKLMMVEPTIMHAEMIIEARHRHHHQGNVFHISLKLHLPGRNLIVTHDPELDHAHEDVYVALRDACDAARKQLLAQKRYKGKGTQHTKARLEGNPRRGDASRDFGE